MLLFPLSTTVTLGTGAVTPSPDWNGTGAPGSGAPVNFFNDFLCSNDVKSDCYRWEAYPPPLTGGLTTAARTVGFDVDPAVHEFDMYFVLAAD